MKSVILCAGKGKRAAGTTGGGNKCLTEIPGHGVVLDYSLRTALGLTDGAIMVIGHKGVEVQRHVNNFVAANFPGANVQFVEQGDKREICGALLCCEALVGGEDFLLFLGDEIIAEPAHTKMTAEFFGPGGKQGLASCGYVRAQDIEDVRKTYSLELSGSKVLDIVEKPSQPANNLMGTGNCLFRNRFFEYIHKYAEECQPDKAYFSFPDVLKFAIGHGETVCAYEIGSAYLNFNDADDIASFLRLVDKTGG